MTAYAAGADDAQCLSLQVKTAQALKRKIPPSCPFDRLYKVMANGKDEREYVLGDGIISIGRDIRKAYAVFGTPGGVDMVVTGRAGRYELEVSEL